MAVALTVTCVVAAAVAVAAEVAEEVAVDTALIQVTNTGIVPETYSIDPRLAAGHSYTLPAIRPPASGTFTLPLHTTPRLYVPPRTTGLDVLATSPVPIDMVAGWYDPALLGRTGTNGGRYTSEVTFTAPELPQGIWGASPNEIGPFIGPAPSSTVSVAYTFTTEALDPAVSAGTGNVWASLMGGSNAYTPLTLGPGQTGTIAVIFTPSSTSGTRVNGNLYLETYDANAVFSDEVAAVPYSYTIR